MDNLDLGREQAAEQVLNRGRDEKIAIAHLRSTLPSMQAIATAPSMMADQRAGKPRRNCTIRVVYDDDGTAIGTEDVEPALVGTRVQEAPRIEEEPALRPEPAPGGFADVFGSTEEP
jgi:hypothetical protein